MQWLKGAFRIPPIDIEQIHVIRIPKLTQIRRKTMHTAAATSIYIKQIRPLKKIVQFNAV